MSPAATCCPGRRLLLAALPCPVVDYNALAGRTIDRMANQSRAFVKNNYFSFPPFSYFRSIETTNESQLVHVRLLLLTSQSRCCCRFDLHPLQRPDRLFWSGKKSICVCVRVFAARLPRLRFASIGEPFGWRLLFLAASLIGIVVVVGRQTKTKWRDEKIGKKAVLLHRKIKQPKRQRQSQSPPKANLLSTRRAIIIDRSLIVYLPPLMTFHFG